MKKFLLIMFAAALILPSCTETEDLFDTETETEVEDTTDDTNVEDLDMYDMIIATKADLIAFRDTVNNGGSAINAILTADIDLSDEEWTPIGTSERIYFAGTFNGGGHTISNLTIDSEDNNQGLFGYVDGGTISKLTLKNPHVKGYKFTGAICGYLSSSTISNCGVEDGSVSGNSNYAGGVIGYAWYSSTITSCYNTGTVSGNDQSIGGVLGGASSYSSSFSPIITSCYNTGMVSGAESVGGVIGYSNDSSVTSCYNTGIVSSSIGYAGGVVGYTWDSTITSCYNTGAVSSSSHTGGMVGYSNIDGIISSCYYLTISGTSYTNSDGTESSTLAETMTSADFVSTLNTAAESEDYVYDSSSINNGYPILSWQ